MEAEETERTSQRVEFGRLRLTQDRRRTVHDAVSLRLQRRSLHELQTLQDTASEGAIRRRRQRSEYNWGWASAVRERTASGPVRAVCAVSCEHAAAP
jgi:DNA-binding response OmpR family regulator